MEAYTTWAYGIVEAYHDSQFTITSATWTTRICIYTP